MFKNYTLFAAVAALSISSAALAEGAPVSAFASYDGEKVASSKDVISEANLGLSTSVLGVGVDGVAVAATKNFSAAKNSVGFEAGLSHALPTMYGFQTSARVAYGRRYEDGAVGFNYYSGEVDVKRPITSDIALIGGYRYRNSFGGSNDFRSNRVEGGLELGLSKHWTTDVLYTHTEGTNLTGNGAVVKLAYKF